MPSTLPKPTPETQTDPGCKKCSAKKCVVCEYNLKETSKFQSINTGITYTIRDSVSCKSSDLIYLIDCDKCKKTQYVGETGQTLQKRFHAHRSDIKRKTNEHKKDQSFLKKETLVAKHFQTENHTLEDMRVTVIELIKAQDANTCIRKKRERFWRHKLKTNYPQGLNVWD